MSLFAITEGFNKLSKYHNGPYTYVINRKITPQFGSVKEFRIEIYSNPHDEEALKYYDVMCVKNASSISKETEENIWTSMIPDFIWKMTEKVTYDINKSISDTTN